MDLNDLTIKQIKEISNLFSSNLSQTSGLSGLNAMIGQKVIVRTYSAGVWFGTLYQKDGKEVILTSARRMWKWWAIESISLSSVAMYGINQEKSKIVSPVESVWMEAIEIIPCSDKAIFDLEGAPHVEAE